MRHRPALLRRTAAGVVLALGLLSCVPAGAQEAEVRVVLLAPTEGPDAVRADEFDFGAHVGAAGILPGAAPGAPRIAYGAQALPGDDKALAKLLKGWRKDGPGLVLAWVPDGRRAATEAAFVKAGVPLLVVSPEPTAPDLDPDRAAFWAGGASAQDEALQAMDTLIQPLGSMRPAILHDGSARGSECARATSFFRHRDQRPLDVRDVGGGVTAEDVAALSEVGADGILYFGGPERAEQLLAACREAKSELPVLLGDGLVSAAVPSFHDGTAEHAWALARNYFEDRGRLGVEDRYPLVDAAQAAGRTVLPTMVLGQRVLFWVRQAVAAVDGDPDRMAEGLRSLRRSGAASKAVFEPYGHAGLVRFDLWKSAPSEREKLPACHQRPATRVPIMGVPAVGFFSARKFAYEPGTHHVRLQWRKDHMDTIEQDLLGIGLWTEGYEQDLEDRILDDLMGRVLSKVNRLFLRNPDGTAIPGVSYNVSFSTEPFPDDVKKSRRWNVLIGGDDPEAGGRAAGSIAWIFSTFIQRTLYLQHKLDPPLSPRDRPHMVGGYVWDTSAEENVRNGAVRSLVGGFSQGMALTTAHELGHLGGCGHDTEQPNSIMNVEAGAGLEFEWAEWTPTHAELLGKKLKLPSRR